MEELFAKIEEKIKRSGYPGYISGSKLYNEISDEIEGKENGTYLFFINQSDSVVFEYHVTVMDDSFNLSFLEINDHDKIYKIDFDKE